MFAILHHRYNAKILLRIIKYSIVDGETSVIIRYHFLSLYMECWYSVMLLVFHCR